MDFAALLRETFPISSDTFELAYVPEIVDDTSGEVTGGVDEDDSGFLWGTFRTIRWEGEGDQRSIRDIKEQRVIVLGSDHRDDPRLPAYLAGWAAALRFVFERHAELVALNPPPQDFGAGLTHRMNLVPAAPVDPAVQRACDALECCMPSDLIHPGVLALVRARTEEDFTHALLSSKKRLGRFAL